MTAPVCTPYPDTAPAFVVPPITLGIWQASGNAGDIAGNLADVAKAARTARDGGVDLLVFPECFLTGYLTKSPVPPIAAQVTQDVRDALIGISAATGVALVVGSYEADGAAIYNSAFFVTPFDGLVACYRKRALFDLWESAQFTPGTQPVVVTYLGLRIGIAICFDVEFPEIIRQTAASGIDLLVVPTALSTPFEAIPQLMVPTRAIENHIFIGYANRVGTDHLNRYAGESVIVGPSGAVLAHAPDQHTGLIAARIDPSECAALRKVFDYHTALKALGMSD